MVINDEKVLYMMVYIDIAVVAKCASEIIRTMGVTLYVRIFLEKVTSEHLGQGNMELGLGTYGELDAFNGNRYWRTTRYCKKILRFKANSPQDQID